MIPTLSHAEPNSALDGQVLSAEPRTVLLQDRLTWRLADIAAVTGLGRRTIERERAAGRFPPPDKKVGVAPLWKPETVRAWVDCH